MAAHTATLAGPESGADAPRAAATPGARRDVLVVTSTFPRHLHDPAGRFLLELVEALPQRVQVVCPDDPGGVVSDIPGLDVRRFANHGLFYGAGAVANRRGGRSGAWASARSLGAMARAGLAAARHADVVWSHWAVPGGVVGALCRQLLGVPHVLTLHSADVWWLEQQRGGRHLARWIARHSDRVLGVSDELVTRFERLSGRRGEVLGCGVIDPLVPAAAAHAAAARTTRRARVGTLSRLVASKGVLDLLAGAAALQAELHLAGDGELADTVRAGCARHARRGVRWRGPLVDDAKRAYLRELDVFLAPYGRSRWGQPEGLPVALLEALAAARPVVAYASAGPPELLRHDHNAVLVPDGDLDALLRETNALVADPARRARLGAAARDSARPWLMPRVARRWSDVLDDARRDRPATATRRGRTSSGRTGFLARARGQDPDPGAQGAARGQPARETHVVAERSLT